MTASSSNNDHSTVRNPLFGAVRLINNADIDEYRYSRYGIGFDRRGSFSFPGGGFGINVIIFGVDMSSSVHVDNKKKAILILGKDPTQELEHTLTADKMYLINFTVTKKWIIMGQIVIYLLMVLELLNSKQKILRLQQLHYVYEIVQKISR